MKYLALKMASRQTSAHQDYTTIQSQSDTIGCPLTHSEFIANYSYILPANKKYPHHDL